MPMEIFMKDIGKMIKLTGMEFTSILRELVLRENGRMINKMDSVKKYGQTVLNLRVNMLME